MAGIMNTLWDESSELEDEILTCPMITRLMT